MADLTAPLYPQAAEEADLAEPVSAIAILAAVVGTYALLERRMDRMESRIEHLITEVRADIVRHLDWHIRGR